MGLEGNALQLNHNEEKEIMSDSPVHLEGSGRIRQVAAT